MGCYGSMCLDSMTLWQIIKKNEKEESTMTTPTIKMPTLIHVFVKEIKGRPFAPVISWPGRSCSIWYIIVIWCSIILIPKEVLMIIEFWREKRRGNGITDEVILIIFEHIPCSNQHMCVWSILKKTRKNLFLKPTFLTLPSIMKRKYLASYSMHAVGGATKSLAGSST